MGRHNAGLDRLKQGDGSGFIHYYNDPSFQKSLSNNHVLSIFEDRGGVLWFGTYGGGVNKYDRERDKFAYFRNEPKNPNSLSGNSDLSHPYRSIWKYAWIGTYGDGLNLVQLAFRGSHTLSIMILTNPNSISSNELLSLTFDYGRDDLDRNHQWLDQFDPSKHVFTHYRYNADDPNSISANYIYSVYRGQSKCVMGGHQCRAWISSTARPINFIHYLPNPDDPNVIERQQCGCDL